jgi:integrase
VLARDQVARLIEAAPGPGLKYKTALSIAYGAGLRGGEVVMLRVGDIDSKRMLIRVELGKGRKDRHAMLSPQLLSFSQRMTCPPRAAVRQRSIALITLSWPRLR